MAKSKKKSRSKAPKPTRVKKSPTNLGDVELVKFEKKLVDVAGRIQAFADVEVRNFLKPEQTASRVAYAYAAARRAATALMEAVGVISKDELRPGSLAHTIHKLSTEVGPEAFNREKISSFTTQDGFRIGMSHKFYASVRKDAKDQAYDWLRRNELGELIIETVNASTLSAAGKSLLEDKGKELPEDLFNTHYQDSFSLTQIKQGGKKPKPDRTTGDETRSE